MTARLWPTRLLSLAFLVAFSGTGCDAVASQTPKPTPTDFAGIVAEFARAGIGVENVTSGDAGCDDQRLARTAIAFDARGVDQADLVRIHLYAFKTRTVYDELRPAVDLCARTYVTDGAAYATAEAPPYVLAGQGPWAPGFADGLRQALDRAAVGG